ncbi:hypothetical protein [Photobacterium satsumensis]|uniref:hypothetical protein n=1 Tax=Photobacterium satsumensis TaxID=2910239 RepID=UPI003D0D2077
MKRIIPVLIVTALAGCKAVTTMNSDGWYHGENLLTEPPLNSEEYTTHYKELPGLKSHLWLKSSDDKESTYVVNIISGKESAKKLRFNVDAPGVNTCETFLSTLITDRDRNGYTSLLWKTDCGLESMSIKSIQLVIVGEDSTYHIRKLWKGGVSDDAFNDWHEHLDKISLCDTRSSEHVCPAGYNQTNETINPLN